MTLLNPVNANECQKTMSLFFKDNKKIIPVKKIIPASVSNISFDRLDKNISMRIQYGEILRSDYQLFVKVNNDFLKKTNESLLGEGMNGCFEEFSPEAAESLVKLINKANGAKSASEAFNKLVKGSEEMFGDSKLQAKTKICALAGGGRCKIFSSALARSCN